MRLRLVHTLSLLLLAAVASAVLAMGGVTAWNLRSGFSAYLQTREAERLEQFVQLLADTAEQAGATDAATLRGLDMRRLLREFARIEGLPEQPPPPRRRPRPPRKGDDDGPPLRPPPRPLPPGPPGPPVEGEPFGRRVAVYDTEGLPLIGRPLPRDVGPTLDRPLRLQGRVVGWVRMIPAPPVPDAVEAGFLRRQYLGITGVAAALVLLALAGAWWLAGRWVRPLLAVQSATARIARGEFGVRLGSDRRDEIGDVMHDIDRMAEGLQRLEGARRRWIADISHELRTPLTVLRGEIEALVDGVRALTPAAMLSLREEVQRLGALVEDLHLLALADLQALPCHFAAADAAALAREVLARFAPQAARQRLALELQAPDSALPVHWDAQRCGQLLGNLLGNSLRYTDAPGRVRMCVAAAGEAVEITVEDSTPGVPAADLPRLFEPLYRAEAARDRHRGGSGLGLAICAAIAQAHGGRIEAAASPLGGLRVRVWLPRRAGAAA